MAPSYTDAALSPIAWRSVSSARPGGSQAPRAVGCPLRRAAFVSASAFRDGTCALECGRRALSCRGRAADRAVEQRDQAASADALPRAAAVHALCGRQARQVVAPGGDGEYGPTMGGRSDCRAQRGGGAPRRECRRVRDCVGNERAAGGGGGEGGDFTLSSTAAWHTKRGARPVSRRRQ